MKNILFSFLLIFISISVKSQTVKVIVFDNDTVKIYKPDQTVVREIVSENEPLTIYRLDEKQKKVLENMKFSKYKKQNTEFIQKVMNSYSALESTLDSLANDINMSCPDLVAKASKELQLIDYYLGSDKPNGKELSNEYNFYANRYNDNRALEARKKYVEDALKSTTK